MERGLNFNLSRKKLDYEEVIAAVEPALSKVGPKKAAETRARLVGILKAQEIGQPNIMPKEGKAPKDLSSDETIRIMKADKGNVTVVLDKKDYCSKMYKHLNEGAYKRIQNKTISAVMNGSKKEVVDYLKQVRV